MFNITEPLCKGQVLYLYYQMAAHTGSSYPYGASKNYPAYIQQTFNVTEVEYII